MKIWVRHDKSIKPFSVGQMFFKTLKEMGYNVSEHDNALRYDVMITIDPVYCEEKRPDVLNIHWEIDPVRKGKPDNNEYDILFVADRGVSELYKDAIFLPPAVHPDVIRRLEDPVRDLSFVGSYGKKGCNHIYPGYVERERLMDLAVEKGFTVFRDFDTYGDRYLRGLAKGRFILNRPGLDDLNLRFFESMAIGCMLYYPVKDVSDLAEEGVHYVAFRNDDEFLEALTMDEKKRRRIEYESRMLILAKHTYENRVNEMMRYIL